MRQHAKQLVQEEPRFRTATYLLLHGRTLSEVARITGCSISTVRELRRRLQHPPTVGSKPLDASQVIGAVVSGLVLATGIVALILLLTSCKTREVVVTKWRTAPAKVVEKIYIVVPDEPKATEPARPRWNPNLVRADSQPEPIFEDCDSGPSFPVAAGAGLTN